MKNWRVTDRMFDYFGKDMHKKFFWGLNVGGSGQAKNYFKGAWIEQCRSIMNIDFSIYSGRHRIVGVLRNLLCIVAPIFFSASEKNVSVAFSRLFRVVFFVLVRSPYVPTVTTAFTIWKDYSRRFENRPMCTPALLVSPVTHRFSTYTFYCTPLRGCHAHRIFLLL